MQTSIANSKDAFTPQTLSNVNLLHSKEHFILLLVYQTHLNFAWHLQSARFCARSLAEEHFSSLECFLYWSLLSPRNDLSLLSLLVQVYFEPHLATHLQDKGWNQALSALLLWFFHISMILNWATAILSSRVCWTLTNLCMILQMLLLKASIHTLDSLDLHLEWDWSRDHTSHSFLELSSLMCECLANELLSLQQLTWNELTFHKEVFVLCFIMSCIPFMLRTILTHFDNNKICFHF